LWNALNAEDRKELEAFVAQGSDAPVPEKWREKTIALRGVKQESSVPKKLFDRMRKHGWTDPVIESVYGPFYRNQNSK